MAPHAIGRTALRSVFAAREGAALDRPRRYTRRVTTWCKTEDGWAVNLDGTDAATEFRLPRIELHSGANGWTCICHRPNGTSVKLALGATPSVQAARHTAAEAMLALGTTYHAELRALVARQGA